MKNSLKTQCPICNKDIDLNKTGKHKPFCSDRCKLIDLGEWASDNYIVEGKDKANQDNQEQ